MFVSVYQNPKFNHLHLSMDLPRVYLSQFCFSLSYIKKYTVFLIKLRTIWIWKIKIVWVSQANCARIHYSEREIKYTNNDDKTDFFLLFLRLAFFIWERNISRWSILCVHTFDRLQLTLYKNWGNFFYSSIATKYCVLIGKDLE